MKKKLYTTTLALLLFLTSSCGNVPQKPPGSGGESSGEYKIAHWEPPMGPGAPHAVLGNNDIDYKDITHIIFVDSIANATNKYWDISAENDGTVYAWVDKENNETTLYIGSNGIIKANEDCSYLFCGYPNLQDIEFNNRFDTSDVTNMSRMFVGNHSLTTLDLSGLDTSNVTDMQAMFSTCYSLTTLDLSGLDTSNVTDMQAMFSECYSLTTLDLSGLDTSNVTDMEHMFDDCKSLAAIDLSSFDTSRVTAMNAMFSSCSSLTTLDLSGFDTSSVTDMEHMFWYCSSLTTLDLSGFDTSSVTDMGAMFYNTEKLQNLILGDMFFLPYRAYTISMFEGSAQSQEKLGL